MSFKVVSSDSTHGDFHPSFYESNHQDHYLLDLPILMLLTLITISNSYSWRDIITSPKGFYPFLGIYQILKSTHFQKRLGKLKRLKKKECEEKRRMQKLKEQKFKKTYGESKGVLGRVLSICKGSGRLKKRVGSTYECQNEMNAKVREKVDLMGIYTKEREESGKIPAKFPTKPSTLRFASCCRTWGTKSRQNLIRTCLECCSVWSMFWANKKASS